jgi:hypothetical protein
MEIREGAGGGSRPSGAENLVGGAEDVSVGGAPLQRGGGGPGRRIPGRGRGWRRTPGVRAGVARLGEGPGSVAAGSPPGGGGGPLAGGAGWGGRRKGIDPSREMLQVPPAAGAWSAAGAWPAAGPSRRGARSGLGVEQVARSY